MSIYEIHLLCSNKLIMRQLCELEIEQVADFDVIKNMTEVQVVFNTLNMASLADGYVSSDTSS